MYSRRFGVPTSFLWVLALGLAACAEGLETVDGACGTVYDGQVCTWATFAGDDVVAFGATVPLDAIESAPLDLEMVFPPPPVAVIPLPDGVAEAIGFDHLMINWEHHGHPPALFSVPHFDFHFYTLTPAAVAAIDCSDVTKPERLPDGYALPDLTIPGLGDLIGLCVPTMGMHAMLAAEVDEVDPFGASMIVGYYGAEPMFVEPMIAREKLLAAESFSMAVPTVAAGEHVRWPSAFEATYDDSARAYRFTFSLTTSD